MSPETDANDHVPLEFLLGARAKYYQPGPSTFKHQEHNSNAKRIFAPSIHPRRREERARHLLQRVLDQEDRIDDEFGSEILSPKSVDKTALQKVLAAATSTPLGDQESIFDEENFHLSLEGAKHSPARIKTLQQLRDDDLTRQRQRDGSFHGYEQNNRSFLDVTGAAARIPRATTRQLRDLKLNVVKAKRTMEDKRTKELVETLQNQKQNTRTALHKHQQLSRALHQQKNPGVVSTNLLILGNNEKSHPTDEWCENLDRKAKSILPLRYQASYYQQEPAHPPRPVLATLNIDSRSLPLSPSKSDADADSIGYPSSTNEEVNTIPGSNDSWEINNDSEQVQNRLRDQQHEIFTNTSAKFLGGGFSAKKTNNRLTQAANEREFLETVLGAHSASILPLSEANKPALRRRQASAGRRRPKPPHKPKE